MFKKNTMIFSFSVAALSACNAYTMENQEIIERDPVVEDITPEYIQYSQRTKSPMEEYTIVCILYTSGTLAGQKACFCMHKYKDTEPMSKSWYGILEFIYKKEQIERNQAKEK